ncbi:MAG: ATP-binding protein [Clostridia bacterium]|nr:ATP-binding protein [Clostridia bacterium]
MNGNTYYFFQSIYGNAYEPVICIDENLSIIYASSAAYDIFGLEQSPILHLNCVFMRKYLKSIKAAFDKGECFSLRFESVNDNSTKRCTMMPYFYDGEKYGVMLFTDIASEEIDNLRKFELKRGISVIESSVISSTSLIVSHMRLIKDKFPTDKSVNIILQNILNIRRMFRHLNILASPSVKGKYSQVIDINEYLRYLTGVIVKQIGAHRLSFCLELCSGLMLAEIEPRIFEILICNLVSNSVKNAHGKSNITVQTAVHDKFNLVVFSDNGIGCKNIMQTFSSHKKPLGNKYGEYPGVGVSIIKKIVTDHDGQVFATENPGGGVSVGFTLPKADNRIPALRSVQELKTESGDVFSTVNIEIAELLDIDNINL